METPFEGSSNYNMNCLKLFDWGECDNFLKSSELEKIIEIDFVSKDREESFHLRNMLEEWQETPYLFSLTTFDFYTKSHYNKTHIIGHES